MTTQLESYKIPETYTLCFDSLVEIDGPILAAVYGKIWRYAQMSGDVCTARRERMSKEIGVSDNTFDKYTEILEGVGLIKDLTPDLRNHTHTYEIVPDMLPIKDKKLFKAKLKEVKAGVKELHSRVKDLHSGVKDLGSQSEGISHEEVYKKYEEVDNNSIEIPITSIQVDKEPELVTANVDNPFKSNPLVGTLMTNEEANKFLERFNSKRY